MTWVDLMARLPVHQQVFPENLLCVQVLRGAGRGGGKGVNVGLTEERMTGGPALRDTVRQGMKVRH